MLLEILLLLRAKRRLLKNRNKYICTALLSYVFTRTSSNLGAYVSNGLDGSTVMEDWLIHQDVHPHYAPQARLAWVDKMIEDRRNNVRESIRNLFTKTH